MANILINNETYTGVDTVRFPLASDSTKCAVYGYLWDGDGDYLINLRQGSITLNSSTLTVYDRNKVKYEFTGTNAGGYCNIYDCEKNKRFANANNTENILQEIPIFRFKSGDAIRVVVTSNTSSDINVTGNKVSLNFIAATSGSTVTNLLASGGYGITVTRDSDNKRIVSEGTFNQDVEVGAIVFYIFSSCTTPPDVTIEIYLNNEQIL